MKNTSPKKQQERQCICDELEKGMDAIHNSCKTAALNGVGISLPTMNYCPWCGGSLDKRKAYWLRKAKQAFQELQRLHNVPVANAQPDKPKKTRGSKRHE